MRLPAILLFSAFLLASCTESALDKTSSLDKIDPIGNLSRADYETLRDVPPVPEAGPPIPRLPLQHEQAGAPSIAKDRILSISVTEKVPLKDVLTELAAKAGVDIEVDPRIEGGVIFSATRQPFPRILDRLCRISGLRYSVDDGMVRVELDEPYLKTYPIDYLSLKRSAESQIGIATNVFGSVSNVTRGGGFVSINQDAQNANNSLTKVATSTTADFWPEVEANIQSILSNTQGTHLRNGNDASVMAQLRQEGLSSGKTFAVNRQAGLITVFANKLQQEAVGTYLNKLRRNINAQVLIEARIVEVALDENYKSGINWRSLWDGSFNAAARFGPAAIGAPFVGATTATEGVLSLSLNTSDFAGILNFVRGFGTTRTLSSPRLTVLNNQPAILKVARNEVYFTSTIESTPVVNSGGTAVAVQRTVNSTPNTVPVGFLMTVQPAIDLDRNEVTLNLRPTVSFIVDRVEDPGIKIAAADANVPEVSSSIPVVAVREMDSVLTIPSGSVAVMGGLMQDSSGNLEKGVPIADEIPFLGNLVKSRDHSGQLSELVILLKASIVNGAPEPDEQDRDLYKRFIRDRHPMAMQSDEDELEKPRHGVHGMMIPSSYGIGEGSPAQFTEVAYRVHKKKRKPKTPEQLKAEEEARIQKLIDEDNDEEPKKKPPSISLQPLDVSPPISPAKPLPPTIVPLYDKRSDTGPRD
ncbi:MAG: secretin N-terminal domain-containing protein [Proteobacteria bacterium]|nr:secretin N-terminal domain-containing protein [Pseudomonadota bacterium]